MSIRTILRTEWYFVVRERVLPALLLASLLLVLFAVHSGKRWADFRGAAVAEAVHDYEYRAARYVSDSHRFEAGLLDPETHASPTEPYWIYAFFPLGAEAPPDPLSVISIGKTDLHPYYRIFTGLRGNDLLHSEEIQNPLSQGIGRFDPAFFVTVILPLLIVALTFNLLARERESGRLLLALAQGVSVGRWILVRFLLRGAVFLGPFLLLLAGAVVIAAPDVLGAPVLPRFLGFLALTAAYGMFWFGLAFLVNGLVRSSFASAVVLVALWGVQLLLLPAAVNAVAEARHPVPSGLLRPIQERDIRSAIGAQDLLEEYLAAHPHLVPNEAQEDPAEMEIFKRRMGVRWIPASETERDSLLARERRLRQAVLHRERVARSLAFVSPSLVVQLAFARLAGTQSEDAFRFIDAQEAYAQEWRDDHRAAVFSGVPVPVERMDRLRSFVPPPPRAPAIGTTAVEVAHGTIAGFLLLLLGLSCMRRQQT